MPSVARTSAARVMPFLKWAGGKRQLLKQYQPYFPKSNSINHYYEPFIGSAAVYFHLQPSHAFLSDINRQLIEIYEAVKKDVDGVIQVLKTHRNEKGYFYQVRAQNPADLSMQERAARLIFMNRTCYNGLFRVNRSGQFNVPFGRYENPTICNEKKLRAASVALQGVNLAVMDFESAVSDATIGDFVYFDPPYVPLSATSNFTSYDANGFGLADQERLAAVFHQLAERQAHVMLSNSDTDLVRQLYGGRGYQIIDIKARRNINSDSRGRGQITELLITSKS